MGWYVDISSVSLATLRTLGYDLVADDEEFRLFKYVHTGEEYIVSRNGCAYLYFDDYNDAAHLEPKFRVRAPMK